MFRPSRCYSCTAMASHSCHSLCHILGREHTGCILRLSSPFCTNIDLVPRNVHSSRCNLPCKLEYRKGLPSIHRRKHNVLSMTLPHHACSQGELSCRCSWLLHIHFCTCNCLESHSAHELDHNRQSIPAQSRRLQVSPGMHTWDPGTCSNASPLCTQSCHQEYRSTYPGIEPPTQNRQTPSPSSGDLQTHEATLEMLEQEEKNSIFIDKC